MDNDIKAAIIKELNIADLPADAQDQIIAQLGEIVLQATTVAILETLSPEKKQEFEAISTEGNPQKVQDFLLQNVPDMPKFLDAELQKIIARFKEADDQTVEKPEI